MGPALGPRRNKHQATRRVSPWRSRSMKEWLPIWSEEDFLNLASGFESFGRFLRFPRFVGGDKELHIKVVLQRFELFAGPVKAARIWPKGCAPTERK